MPSKIMPYLIINYPNPQDYEQCLHAVLEQNPTYLEIQLPFSNPIADGETIWEADQEALKYRQPLVQSLQKIHATKHKSGAKTELVLMSYITPLMQLGMQKVADLLIENEFYGLVCPDLNFGSLEQKQLCKLWANQKPCLIPVVSPLTTSARLNEIKADLKPWQMIYPTARVGTTGKETDLLSPSIQNYFEFLKQNLNEFEIAVGFGIREKKQIDILNEQGFVAVIATKIIQEINTAKSNNLPVATAITKLLQSWKD